MAPSHRFWGNAICVQLTTQAAGMGEDVWGSAKGQAATGGKRNGWIRKEHFWKQIKGKEREGMMK